MTTLLRRAAVAAFLLLPAASVAGAQDFSWNGSVKGGNWLRVRNLNGAVIVEKGTGDRVEITATKRASDGGDPEVVRIEAKQAAGAGGDVIVCAMWDENGTCSEDEYHATGRRNRDWGDDDRRNVSVEFRVKLPAGVKLDASTVNGKLRVDGATSEVRARTVNGGIDASSSGGPVRASTVNGGIDVRMGTFGADQSIEYSTVNGSVKVRLPENVDADVELSTVNGSLDSDFPLTVQGRIDKRHVRARLGKGGPRLTFKTVNGSVQLIRG